MVTKANTESEPRLQLLSSAKDLKLKPSQRLIPVYVEITPEGCYLGRDDRFQDPVQGTIFKIAGFDRSNGREFWVGRAYTVIPAL